MNGKEADQFLFLNTLKVLLDRNGLLSFIVKLTSHFLHHAITTYLKFAENTQNLNVSERNCWKIGGLCLFPRNKETLDSKKEGKYQVLKENT